LVKISVFPDMTQMEWKTEIEGCQTFTTTPS
jgi:hypothetical protein